MQSLRTSAACPPSPRSFGLFAAGILLTAAVGLVFRLPGLALRPVHCDEANQAMLAGTLFDAGIYRYDPCEYHGPTMPWLTQPVLWLSGTRDFAHCEAATYRLVPVVFSVGMILLLLALGDGLGRGAAVIAGLLTAISPAVVFYARYFIHETLLAFFTMAAIAAGWRYLRTRSLGWAVAMGASLGLMVATKETWVFAAAAACAGLAFTIVWTRWHDGAVPGRYHFLCQSAGRRGQSHSRGLLPQESGQSPIPAIRPCLRPAAILAAALAAVLVAGAFFSSFGTNWRGLTDSLASYAIYWRRGSQGGVHTHPWYYYLQLLFAYRPARGFFWSEGLIGLLAAIGFAFALTGRGIAQSQRPLPRFLAFYTLALLALYSGVPYKTPWCMLSFFQGMILLAGVGAWAILRAPTWLSVKAALGLALAAAIAHLGWQSYALNFRFYADQRNPWVYAHTSTDMPKLAATMERIALVAPEGHQILIHVVTPENYWPLPWYLRQFSPNHVGYWQDPAAWAATIDGAWGPESSPARTAGTDGAPSGSDAKRWSAARGSGEASGARGTPIAKLSVPPAVPPAIAGRSVPPAVLIFTPDAQPVIDARLPAGYNRQMIFGLRPGVLLCVYVRDDLWQRFVTASSAGDRRK